MSDMPVMNTMPLYRVHSHSPVSKTEVLNLSVCGECLIQGVAFAEEITLITLTHMSVCENALYRVLHLL
jgi:hypothetical protein